MKLEDIIKLANSYGFILTSDAIKTIEDNLDYIDEELFIKFLKDHDKILINKDDIEKIFPKLKEDESIEYDRSKIEERIEILNDPGRFINPGTISDNYSLLLKDRYKKLSVKIKRLAGSVIPTTVNQASTKVMRNNEVFVTVFIYRKKIFQDKIQLLIEDDTGSAIAYVYKNINPRIYDLIAKTPLDVVIGLKAYVTNKGKIIVRDVITPRIRTRFQSKSGKPIYSMFISDLHVGSKFFNQDIFERFIEILKGVDVGLQVKKMIRRLKYIIIAGDLVDGVGVYQGQENEIEIRDISEQYNFAYKLLKEIPIDIKVIIIPGNHDASRSALPQPPIFNKVAKKFYEDRRFILLGNPANVSLHNVNIVIYHGDFIQDILSTTPGLQNGDISSAVNILLSYSHLAPQIGLNTKVAPEPKDHLIINDGIHILHFGHTHKFNISKQMGVLSINSGTFQNQTKYQKMMRVDPDIGYLTLVNLLDLTPQVIRIM